MDDGLEADTVCSQSGLDKRFGQGATAAREPAVQLGTHSPVKGCLDPSAGEVVFAGLVKGLTGQACQGSQQAIAKCPVPRLRCHVVPLSCLVCLHLRTLPYLRFRAMSMAVSTVTRPSRY